MHWLYLVLIFLTVSMGVVAGYFVVVDVKQRDERRATRRVEEFRKDSPLAAESVALFESLGEFDLARPGGAGPWGVGRADVMAFLKRDWLRPLHNALKRSGLKYRSAHVLGASTGLGLTLGVLGWFGQGALLGVPAFAAGAAAPVVYVVMQARARRERFLAQLPGAFELMARVIRSGQSVPQAFQAVSDSFEDPIAGAFARCREQQNMGLAPEVAFQELAEKSGVLDMRIFVMAMLIQRSAGGNLSEVLERLAALVRDRRKVRMQVQTLTAEGRLQAAILLVLPFLMLVAMRFVNRTYADELFQHTGLLAATAVSMGVGALWIRRIIDIKV